MSVTDKLASDGAKKLLALDGGGIRGVITLEFLAEIEATVRTATSAGNDFVLADYFDYVAGTSTGAIIAMCISLGMSVADIQTFYQESGGAMFDKASLLKRFTRHKYEDQELARTLREVIANKLGGGEPTLGDLGIKTLLMMVMRNVTTDSPWPVSNNPAAKYNDPAGGDSNLRLPLWKLVRASTAAPVFFPPEEVEVGSHRFVFVDGGITMYNNPAFQLFLMATLAPYNLRWQAGEDRMLVVSVGTGAAAKADAELTVDDLHVGYNIAGIPGALMYAALNEQDLLCRVFGRCRHGAELDREIGDLTATPSLWPEGDRKLFTYMRYNAELSREGLDAVGLEDVEPANVSKLDSTEFMGDLARVGRANAKRQVQTSHFGGFV